MKEPRHPESRFPGAHGDAVCENGHRAHIRIEDEQTAGYCSECDRYVDWYAVTTGE